MVYKTVLGPKQVPSEVGYDFAGEFDKIINQYAAQGWEYHSVQIITQMERKTALSPIYANYYLFIFKK